MTTPIQKINEAFFKPHKGKSIVTIGEKTNLSRSTIQRVRSDNSAYSAKVCDYMAAKSLKWAMLAEIAAKDYSEKQSVWNSRPRAQPKRKPRPRILPNPMYPSPHPQPYSLGVPSWSTK